MSILCVCGRASFLVAAQIVGKEKERRGAAEGGEQPPALARLSQRRLFFGRQRGAEREICVAPLRAGPAMLRAPNAVQPRTLRRPSIAPAPRGVRERVHAVRALPRDDESAAPAHARDGAHAAADDAARAAAAKAPRPPPPPSANNSGFPTRRRLRALVRVMTKPQPTPAGADASPPVRRRRALIGAAAVAAAVSGRAGGARAAAVAEGGTTAVAPPPPLPPSPPPPDPPITHTAFLDLALGGKPAGRLELGLFGGVAPKAVANFLALAGVPIDDVGRKSSLVGKYKGVAFHRLVKGFVLQGGDFERGNGTGGASIYSRFGFEDEAFVPHGGPGALSCANRGPNSNGCQFFVTLAPTPWLDGKHVVFGRATPASMALLARIIEGEEVDFFSKPRVPITIVGAGLVESESAPAAAEGA
jgi:cyclophilin family peptidyl-prolyl cis-trans isomerase